MHNFFRPSVFYLKLVPEGYGFVHVVEDVVKAKLEGKKKLCGKSLHVKYWLNSQTQQGEGNFWLLQK
jgi:hypothetical protein